MTKRKPEDEVAESAAVDENTPESGAGDSEPQFKVPKMAAPVQKPVAEEPPADAAPKKKVLPFEETYLRSIPKASQYEKSFMHRDTITHVVATSTDYIVTASIDGHLKFWKKKYAEGVEFVKHFRCHLHPFAHVTVNFNGTLLATVCSQDKSVKIFDVENFDMINMLKFDYAPKTAGWIHGGGCALPYLAVSDCDSGTVRVYDAKGSSDPVKTLDKLHGKPVRIIEYNHQRDIVVSCDDGGMVEWWSAQKGGYQHPTNVSWEYKTDTDLYEFLKSKTVPVCMRVSPTGKLLATVSEDRRIRIFSMKSGKMTKMLDETLQKFQEAAKQNKNFGLQNMEWNRRVAAEKDMDKDRSNAFRHLTICWDLSGHFLLYPTPIGIRVYNTVTDEVVREIGKEETIRLLGVSMCRAVPDVNTRMQGAAATIDTESADNPLLNKVSGPDPIIACYAVKKNRFYLFTNSEPYSTEDGEGGEGTGRDIFNEKPKKEDSIIALEQEREERKLCSDCVLHTSFGDIHIKLFPQECPRAVENFCTHARRGYYNGHCFHRVIKSFMVQTGDPTGKGTGGQSIWGEDFEDEFHPRLRHDKPYKVSMANAGPNSNGSQFFITVVPAEWLDGKNTMFGEVTEGFNVVQKINLVNTYEKSGRPKTDIRIVSITLK